MMKIRNKFTVLRMGFFLLALAILSKSSSSQAQDIMPLQSSTMSNPNAGVNYVDASQLAAGTTFYSATRLDVQLLLDAPLWTFWSTGEHSQRLFEGESDDSSVAMRLLRYTSTTTGQTVLVGTVHDRTNDMFYQLRPDDAGRDTVYIMSEEDIPPLGEPPERSLWDSTVATFTNTNFNWNQIQSTWSNRLSQWLWSSSRDAALVPFNTVTIDVMILWSESSECSVSGLETGCALSDITLTNMQAAVALMVEETNTALTNSATLALLNLVHQQRDSSGYRETSMRDTLGYITNTDGRLDYIQGLRDTHKADLVQFIIDNRLDSDNLGGIAWLPQRNCFGCYDCSRGFSVICAKCMTNYISAHEFGHNLNCLHDRGTQNACNDCSKNYGYRNPDGKFRTIMAYQCRSGQCDNNAGNSCPRIAYFSGEGEYNGDSRGGSDNNCGAEISRRKQDIANYR